jgi:putative Ca2+/H+ antiporter (TMEM165/GDT1 family)
VIFEFGILFSAFTLQLLALPGEKGQFIISALATEYKPAGVVVGSSLAFGLWTIVEIWLGNKLKGSLPESLLEWSMILLLCIFALLIIYQTYNEDEKDSGFRKNKYFKIVSNKVPNRIEGGVMAFLVLCIGEFGDKTQIITISLAAKFGQRPEIWIGEMLAIIPITVLNAFLVHKISEKYKGKKVNLAASFLLLIFAFDIFLSLTVGFSVLPI